MSQVDYKVSRIVEGNVELLITGIMDQQYWLELYKVKDLSIPAFVESTLPFGMVSIQNYEIVAGAYNEVASPDKVLRDLLSQKELFVTISFNFMLPFNGLVVKISNEGFGSSQVTKDDYFILPGDVSNLTLSNKISYNTPTHLMSNTLFMEVLTNLRHTIVSGKKFLQFDNDRSSEHLKLHWLGCPSEAIRARGSDHQRLVKRIKDLHKDGFINRAGLTHSLDTIVGYSRNMNANDTAITRARDYTGIAYTHSQKVTKDVRSKLKEHMHYDRWKTWTNFTPYIEVTKPYELSFGLLTT